MNEIFYTVQGEGREAGLPTVFVRTSGCNLRCSWCDTAYSFYEGRDLQIAEVLEAIAAHAVKRVCLTGGEPLLQKDALDLVRELLARGYHVTIETSGSLSVAALSKLEPRRSLVLNVDVKCPGSGMEEENDWSNLPLLEAHDQVKFVIADERDYAFARAALREHRPRAEVVFQACWQQAPGGCSSNLRWLAERVLKDGLDVRVGTQLHKHIWGEAGGHALAPAAPRGREA